jgi:hypothetical protein
MDRTTYRLYFIGALDRTGMLRDFLSLIQPDSALAQCEESRRLDAVDREPAVCPAMFAHDRVDLAGKSGGMFLHPVTTVEIEK